MSAGSCSMVDARRFRGAGSASARCPSSSCHEPGDSGRACALERAGVMGHLGSNWPPVPNPSGSGVFWTTPRVAVRCPENHSPCWPRLCGDDASRPCERTGSDGVRCTHLNAEVAVEIVVEKAKQVDAVDGRTCNCGSNASGTQGSMCRASETPAVVADATPGPPLAQ